MANAQQEFLDELKSDDIKLNDDSQFNGILSNERLNEPKPEEGKKVEESEDSPRNRRERRIMEKYQSEREANIALNERLKALTELGNKSVEKNIDDPDLVRLFGDTPEGKMAQDIFSRKFDQLREEAREQALEALRSEQEKMREEERSNSHEIDEGFSRVEDTFNVDLSGETKSSRDLRNGFIDFLSEISPKNDDGEITEYADFNSSFKVYQQIADKGKSKEVSNRQKNLADRSMTSGSSNSIPQSPKGPVTFQTARRYIDSLHDQNN